jgi:mevalonate kinase
MEWLGKIDDPQKWRLFYDYLNFIGRERYGRLGYDFETDMQYLKTNIPAENLENLLHSPHSFDSFLNPSTDAIGKSLQEAQAMLKQKNKKIESLLQENEVLKKSSHALLTDLQEIKGSRKYRLVLRLAKLKSLLNGKSAT